MAPRHEVCGQWLSPATEDGEIQPAPGPPSPSVRVLPRSSCQTFLRSLKQSPVRFCSAMPQPFAKSLLDKSFLLHWRKVQLPGTPDSLLTLGDQTPQRPAWSGLRSVWWMVLFSIFQLDGDNPSRTPGRNTKPDCLKLLVIFPFCFVNVTSVIVSQKSTIRFRAGSRPPRIST